MRAAIVTVVAVCGLMALPALPLPTGLVRDPSGRVVKHPDIEVQDRIALIFETSLRVRSASRVVPAWLDWPTTVSSCQLMPWTPVTTPIVTPSRSRTGPCSMCSSTKA